MLVMPEVVLGFDFGLKRIGVALGQSVTKTARLLPTLAAVNGKPDWSKIRTLIDEWQPDILVVGLPLNLDDTPQPITAQARQFADKLIKHYQLPVDLIDERLTTKEARARVFEQQGYRGLQATDIDSVAAVLIVEDYFHAG